MSEERNQALIATGVESGHYEGASKAGPWVFDSTIKLWYNLAMKADGLTRRTKLHAADTNSEVRGRTYLLDAVHMAQEIDRLIFK